MSHPAAGSKEAAIPVFAAASGNASVAIVCDVASSSSSSAAAAAAARLSPADVAVAVEGGSGGGAAVAALAPFRLPDDSSRRSIWIATVSLPPQLPQFSSSSSGVVVSLGLAPGAAGGLARARAPLSFRVSSSSSAASQSPSSSPSPSSPRGICGLVETTVAEVS
jgi:hypothetical protein